ncbi:MAG: potassium channel family protein, partial [bacterium]|nr:potassium channel family protein [bacterium]
PDIDSWGDTIWWTIVTMTTVGYGDILPVTGTGKAAAIVLMLAGITIFGFITANLAAWFTKSKTEAEEHNLAQQVNKLSVAVEKLSGQIEALKAEDEPTS